ncbi:probable serine/threonine-protein kinase clkA [Sitodiplosis mosellana]|uniref:probable serine/threonine-protein kinase clkA n=1 Tax=Sitodiplosis mosellana TaxID=263140 RepID=UPI002444F7A5|nr:probable serine/threonine-protein kinase clkA [Sitodiplosis mosellana]
MFFKIIICLLITFNFQSVKCKPWSDQISYNNYNNSNPFVGNPHYNNMDQQYYRQEPTTTSTVKPLYPTLYTTSIPQYRPNGDNGQGQVPVNPFDGQPFHPLQPNIGNRTHHNRNHNDYSNNNFDYPFDNTRTRMTTYPPFDGSTKRSTFPTRQFNTLPPNRPFINSNPTQPTYPYGQNDRNYNQYPNNQYNSSTYFGNNHQNRNRYNSNNNNTAYQNRPFPNLQSYGANQPQSNNHPNNGNHQNIYNPTAPSAPQVQPLPNSQSYDGRNPTQSSNQPNNGNINQNGYNPSTPENRPFPNPQVHDGRNPAQSNYHPYDGKSNQNNFNPSAPQASQNRPFSGPQTYDGRNPSQSSYQPNNGNSMYPNSYMNQISIGSVISQGNQMSSEPDFDPNGIALAPFPGDMSNPSNAGARKQFNYDNLHHRYPSKPNVDITFNGNDGSRVPLANYGSSQVPLAPL